MTKSVFSYLLLMIVSIIITSCKNKSDKVDKPSTKTIIENPAITNLKEQIHQYPDSVRLYDQLIDQLTATRNYTAAAAWCDSLLQINKEKNFSYWFVKGDLQRQALQYDEAILSYQIYLKRFPDDEQILLNLANTAAEAGKNESVTMSDDLIKRSSTKEMKADAFFIKGVYYSRTKQFDKSIENFDQTIINRYSFWEAYIEKAIVFYDQRKYDKSLEVLTQLQQVNQSYPDTYYWIGKCNEALNKKAEAIRNYETAYGLDKTFIEAKEKIDSFSNIK